MRWTFRSLVSAWLLGFVAACGGEDPSTAATSSTTIELSPTTMTEVTTTSEATTTTQDPARSGNFSADPIDWLDVQLDKRDLPNTLRVTNRSAMPIEFMASLDPGQPTF